MNIIISRAARDDLAEIWLYGAKTWSVDRAESYGQLLMLAISGLPDQPRRGPTAEQIAPDVRRLVVASHSVFYRIEHDSIAIIRILHQSRDAGRWVD